MFNILNILNELGKSMAKRQVDNNPNANYYQKAYAKSCIDGQCDDNTFSARVMYYYTEYIIQDMKRYQAYLHQQLFSY